MKITNRHAKNYKALEKIEAGIVLLGSEVKALREGHGDISSAYVKILGAESYLINAKIFPYKYSRIAGYQEDRSRKLLLHKKEILALKSKLDQGKFTIIPTSLYLNNGNFKVEIILSEGKNKRDKRKDSKRAVLDRVAERELKNSL